MLEMFDRLSYVLPVCLLIFDYFKALLFQPFKAPFEGVAKIYIFCAYRIFGLSPILVGNHC